MFKTLLVYIFLLSCLSFVPGKLFAQPGWYDMTRYYYYTLVDEKGIEIEFKKNKKYTIRVDGISYRGASIPSEQFVQATPNSDAGFKSQVSINDLTLNIPLRSYKPVEIEIIRGNDTMHLDQETGPTNSNARTLQFIPGHYYFPRWTESAFDRLPVTSGNVRIINSDQRHFLVSRENYEALTIADYTTRNELEKKMVEGIISNFAAPHFLVTKTIEKTVFNGRYSPFEIRSWETMLYPTRDSNLFIGLIGFTLDTTNLYMSTSAFAIFNKRTNSIHPWFPKNNIHLFATGKLYVDSFNNLLYNSTYLRDHFDEPCTYWNDEACPMTRKIFQSRDEGKNWTEDTALTNLFDRYNLRELEFLDANHTLVFALSETQKRKREYQQGTYYLLKNKQIIDSLKTPEDVHYNDNYARYRFTPKGDTVFLGPWGINPYDYYGSPYSSPKLIKTGTNWHFDVTEEHFSRNPQVALPKDSIRDFKNFQLLHNREMIFKNGAGTMKLNNEISESGSDTYVLEQGTTIILIDQPGHITMLSFDAGSNWYIYPQPLNDRGVYKFIEINKQNTMSFFDTDRMEKVVYRFALR